MCCICPRGTREGMPYFFFEKSVFVKHPTTQLNAFFYPRDHLEMNRSQSWTNVSGLAISGPSKILTSKEHGIHTDRSPGIWDWLILD